MKLQKVYAEKERHIQRLRDLGMGESGEWSKGRKGGKENRREGKKREIGSHVTSVTSTITHCLP